MPATQTQQVEVPKEHPQVKDDKAFETPTPSKTKGESSDEKSAKPLPSQEPIITSKEESKKAEGIEKETEKEKTPSSVYGKEGKEEVGKLAQLVIFNLGKEEYGLMITDVKEILKTEKITFVPNAPDFIKGIINVRGQIVVIIDLEKKFSIGREEKGLGKHLVLAEQEGNTYGLMVDQVTEVLRVPEKSIQDAPELIAKKISADYLKGVATIQNRLIILLDIKKVLAEDELAKAGAKIGKLHVKPEEMYGGEKKAPEKVKPEAKKEEAKDLETNEELPTKKELEEDLGKKEKIKKTKHKIKKSDSETKI